MRSYHLLVALAATVGLTFAQTRERGQGGDGPRPGFMRMNPVLDAIDIDQNGTITADELARSADALAKLDKDGDGKLNREELRPNFGPGGGPRGRGPGRPGAANPDDFVKRLMEMDRDSNGSLSKDEVPERMQGMFERGDANKDGALSEDEIRKMAAAQSGDPGRGERKGGMPMDRVFAAVDTDRDGTISAVEIRSAAASLAKLDANGNGSLEETEVRPAFGPGGRGRRKE